MIKLRVNNEPISVANGTTVAVAVMASETSRFRRSVSGESRLPSCGMGVCFECRVTINGAAQQRSCTILAQDGMEVVTDD